MVSMSNVTTTIQASSFYGEDRDKIFAVAEVNGMSGLKLEDLKKLSLKQIESRNIRIDYVKYLTDSNSLKDVYLRISDFELEDSFSIRLSLLLENRFFDRLEISPKEREQFIKRLEKFPKLKVFRSIEEQEYKVVNVIRHSTKILEVKLVLYEMESVTLEELPYRIRWVWNDIINRFN